MTPDSGAKVLSQERFGRFAGEYVTSQTHAQGLELDRLVEIARPQPDWIALDVATGGGHTALRFAPFVAQVVATEITPEMLEKARRFITGKGVANVAFEPSDAEDLPFEDGAFDLVTCRIAAHHFPDPARFVQEGARVLKGGGLLLVQDHVMPEDEDTARSMNAFERLRDPSHVRACSESEWTAMFAAAGLRVEHTEKIIKLHRFLPWVERQARPPEVVERLVDMVDQVPEAFAEWMQPRNWGTPEASFVNRHLIIAGRKT